MEAFPALIASLRLCVFASEALASSESGAMPISSGRRAISSSGGRTPVATVNTPSATQADCQPKPSISMAAASGRSPSPTPCTAPNQAKAMGRRRMNQLLMAVVVPSSSGLENTARPGTYMA